LKKHHGLLAVRASIQPSRDENLSLDLPIREPKRPGATRPKAMGMPVDGPKKRHGIWEETMKKLMMAAAVLALSATVANAEKIGISLATFDDNYQTVMKNKIQAYADTLSGVEVQFEDAQSDLAKQLDQIKNFIASGVDGIMVTLVDTSAAQALTDAAAAAGVPLVYMNLQPINLETLPEKQAYVGANEIESGTLGAFEACKILRAQGKSNGAKGYIMIGDLAHAAAVQRTKDVKDVIGMDMCNFMSIIDEQTGGWSRDKGQSLMTNWLSTGAKPDFVFGNNDEMAIGAIQALKAAGIDMKDVVVVGVDATQDALVAMKAEEMDVTVFQNGGGIGTAALDTALRLAKGEKVNRLTYVPFELVTPSNMADYAGKN
jgi:inositol transport system substrate-binding protein